MVKTCKPGRERGGEREDTAPGRSPPRSPWGPGRSPACCRALLWPSTLRTDGTRRREVPARDHLSGASAKAGIPSWGAQGGQQGSAPQVLLLSPPGTYGILFFLADSAQGWVCHPSSPRARRAATAGAHACPQPKGSSAETGDLLREEGQGLAGPPRDSVDSKGAIILPQIKRANESPDLHVIHKAFSETLKQGEESPKQSRALCSSSRELQH